MHYAIPPFPTRLHVEKKKKMEHHISREGSVMPSMERRAFVEFNMTNWGKVCSSLLAVPVTHIQWGALCGPASPVRYTAHCASHWFTVKTTWLFIQHVADKPTRLVLYTDIYNAGCFAETAGWSNNYATMVHSPASRIKMSNYTLEWQSRRENKE